MNKKWKSKKGRVYVRPPVTPGNAFFLERILRWNPFWFDNSMEKIKSNIIIGREFPLIPTSLCYDSIKNYSTTWKPLFILEFFHSLMKDINDDEDGDVKKKTKSIKITASFFDNNHRKIVGSRYFKSVTVVKTIYLKNEDEDDDLSFRAGDLVYVSGSKHKNNKIFGFVEAVDIHCDERDANGGKFTFIFSIVIGRLVGVQDRLVVVEKVTCLNQYLRMLQALEELPRSPLYDAIMKPNLIDYKIADGDIKPIMHLFDEKKLNLTQVETMKDIVQTINNREEKICLVQGPPGTGKSTLIINIVEKLLKDNSSQLKMKKILLCAPSNKAIDGVVLRLMKIQSHIKFNMVRYGRDEKIDPDVKEVSLSHFVHEEFKKRYSFEKMSKAEKREKELELEAKILMNADIVASTLTSCCNNSMKILIEKNDPEIPVCIIDEAGQSTEMATIIPLLLDVKTMILVGDPQQLPPTIISKEAKTKGMGISLFRRAQIIFQEQEEINPIKMLNVQYRMDDSIALWPNKYFYKGLIKNEANNLPLNFQHYKILNHNSPESIDTFDNKNEAKIIMDLLGIIVDEMKLKKIEESSSVGVITPYRDQRKVISDIVEKKLSSIQSDLNSQRKIFEDLADKENENLNKISLPVTCTVDVEKIEKKIKELEHLILLWGKMEVNTVDSFQGQERDIIIMSCVRSRRIGFVADPNRLNVSLTRAKHTLILCGNFDTFKKNAMWRNLLKDAESRGVHANIDQNINSKKLKSLIIVEETKEKKKKKKKKVFYR